jgi:hypothetical protein
MASIDTDAAIQVAAKANVLNLKAMGRARMREQDKALEQIEAVYLVQLAKVTSGAHAVQEHTRYKAMMAKAEASKATAAATIQGVLNTGFALESLSARKMALWEQWRMFFGQFPAVAQMQSLAEVEVRNYMDTLRKGVDHE